MSRTKFRNHGCLDDGVPIKKEYVHPEVDPEDANYLPKKDRMRHAGSWRYKRGYLPYKAFCIWVRAFVGKPYNDFHQFVCQKFHKDSIEGMLIRKDSRRGWLLPYKYELDENSIIRRKK